MDKLSKHIDEKLDILYNMITKGPYIVNPSISIRKNPLKSIAFSVDFYSIPGENIWVLGSIPEFGNWGLNGALSLGWNRGGIWKGERKIERDINYFEFKFVLEKYNKIIYWQEGGNNAINLEEITRDRINKSGRYNHGEYVYNHENRTLLINYNWNDYYYDSGYDS